MANIKKSARIEKVMSDQHRELDFDAYSPQDRTDQEQRAYARQANGESSHVTRTQGYVHNSASNAGHKRVNIPQIDYANTPSSNATNSHTPSAGTPSALHIPSAGTPYTLQTPNAHTPNAHTPNAQTDAGHTRVTAPQPYQTNQAYYTNNPAATSARPTSAYHQNYNDSDLEYTQNASTRSAGTLHTLATIIASIVYWPIAIIGVSAPFLPSFNHGNLHMWQTVFSRFWLAFVLLGFIYALVINLGGIRMSSIFDGRRTLKIGIAIIADIALSFVLIRIVCFL